MLVTLAFDGPVAAKRKMPPKTNICNKTKHKQYVATSNYAGRGRHRTSGWTFIAPGACSEFRDDAFHFRGSNRKVVGVDAASTRTSCVTNAKVFSIVSERSKQADAATCAANKGKLVTFYRAWTSARTLHIVR